uniref:Uncharacterized protein n=1 Tax=Panagrolaimus superbus TaxID=310955 RepID=A0A914YR92_9BILA
MSESEYIHPSLLLDEESKFLKMGSHDFSLKFMYQLVFNVNNLTHQYPYVNEQPYFAPLKVGEYLVILDAKKIAKISDIRHDSLSPWNKKNRKSKQHCFIVDPNTGTCRRADTREDREQSNAHEYYAKHPDQKVTKMIFMACKPNRARPTPNTFAVIYYKVDEALFHQSLIPNRASSSHNQSGRGFYENDILLEDSEIKEDPEKNILSLLDGMLFAKSSNPRANNNGILNINESSSTSAVSTVSQGSGRKRMAISETSAVKRPAKITILNPVGSTSAPLSSGLHPLPSSSSSDTILIRKRYFGLFEYHPYPCDPPSGLQKTRQSSYIDQAAKNYYTANNLSVEVYHTSFPFQLQKGKDLLFQGKRKCAHCNADITVAENSTIITHYEPFEYLVSNTNHITTGHGNRIICNKFSCLKARYPFIDEQCFIVNNTVSQAEAKKVFDLIF